MKNKTMLAFAIMLAVSVAGVSQSQGARIDAAAPVYGAAEPNAIPGRYIVVFRAGAEGHEVTAAVDAAARLGGKVHYTYTDALQGFAATLPEAALQGLRHNPNIEYIEADQTVSLDILTSQSVSTWNLDRIDQKYLPLNGSFNYLNTGLGVTAYIIDTGIRPSHAEFADAAYPADPAKRRASVGYDAVNDGRNGIDCNGHGTHVAGTIGGLNYGVAKDVTLVAVRVLDCSGSGTVSGVVSGVDWVTGHKKALAPAVANMSLGGRSSTALDNAVKTSIGSGVTYAVAAGNDRQDACRTSPARVPAAITVGATTLTDARASYSNYGACLDLFAPGSSVTSAWNSSDTATNTISGTSMATPNVTGVAALFLQGNWEASPATVSSALTGSSTKGVVTNPGNKSPNRLLYTVY
ncbi:MAG TPA: serine protease [Geobacter sp.]|nr:serine protease [Geobacter sp.]